MPGLAYCKVLFDCSLFMFIYENKGPQLPVKACAS